MDQLVSPAPPLYIHNAENSVTIPEHENLMVCS